MFEMFEAIMRIILLLGLFGIAWMDYKTKLIDVRWLWLVGFVGVILLFVQNGIGAIGRVALGIVPGMLLLAFAWASNESIGFGDGWLFVVTGIFLGVQKNLLLLY